MKIVIGPTSLDRELIIASEHPQSCSNTSRKNIQTGHKKKKCEVSNIVQISVLKNLNVFKNQVISWIHGLFVLCVLRVLANDAMKSLNLERHLKSKLPDLAEKPLEYLQKMSENMQEQEGVLKVCLLKIESSLKASYMIALQVAKNKSYVQPKKS